MWCWRRMEKISWTDHVRNEEVLLRVKKQRNILHEITKRKANWIGHILHRNWLLQRVIEGKIKGGIEVTGIRGRRRRKLLDDLKERRGYSHLKEEALDRTMWRARFGRGFGPVVRPTTKWMNEWPRLNFLPWLPRLPQLTFYTPRLLLWVLTIKSSPFLTTLKLSMIDCNSVAKTWKNTCFYVLQCIRGVELYLQPFLTSTLDGGDWLTLYPGGFAPRKGSGTDWMESWVGPKIRSERKQIHKRNEGLRFVKRGNRYSRKIITTLALCWNYWFI